MNRNLKPWQVETFKGPACSNFDEKHVASTYTPEGLLVFTLDEQTQVQASIAPSGPCL
jgi:hypothetical protein